jgi:hypothetical protein
MTKTMLHALLPIFLLLCTALSSAAADAPPQPKSVERPKPLSMAQPPASVQPGEASARPRLVVPFTSGHVLVDGKLNEPCYQAPPLVEAFVVAGQPAKQPPKTKAWLFWQRDKLIFAFECEATDLAAAPPSAKEHDVDGQDRVELFLWSGRRDDAYYCIEIGARGALHDYSARFYRHFDDRWSLKGLEYAVKSTPRGYSVEATISRTAMERMGFRLESGAQWRLGLFRADFASGGAPGEPTWITWVDAKGPKPDFHVARSFGDCTLGPEK